MAKRDCEIDIVDIKNAIKNGLFRVFISKGIIYLKDMNTEEVVQIGKVDADEYMVQAQYGENDNYGEDR